MYRIQIHYVSSSIKNRLNKPDFEVKGTEVQNSVRIQNSDKYYDA